MEYYGIRGQTLEIFKSYLKNRRQLVEIDTYRSDIKQSLDCSVIQGSKLSGILYTIYTNEIPLIHTLMSDKIFTKLTGKPIIDTKDIEHSIVSAELESLRVQLFLLIGKLQLSGHHS